MMIFKDKAERIDYAIGTFAMLSGFTYQQIEKYYEDKSEDDKKIFLDTFAFEGSVFK